MEQQKRIKFDFDQERIVKIQAIYRGNLVMKKGAYQIIKKCKELQENFQKFVKGYHMVNKAPIKEAVWEEINCEIAKILFFISDEAKGNHASGKDNRFDNINISNKTTKLVGTNVPIPSYRLGSVCNNKDIGTSKNIIEEIKKRDSSFDYYSLLIRDERENSHIEYMWYMIPKDCYLFKIDHLNYKTGQRGKKKGEIVGWESKYSSIRFSMSSQLWFSFSLDKIKKYMVCYTEVDNSKPKINYSQIYDSFCNTI
tara:strand:- start:808 stop:1569 length:762 start_codon:yes stop_codon:yes gene_type:complete